MTRLAWLLLLLPLLGGCLQTTGGSVAGTECKFLERPEYAVRGARQYDQDWVDSTVEGAIGACRWKRPAPRPPEMDAASTPKAMARPAKKRSLIHRVKDRIWPRTSVAPIVVEPAPEIAVQQPLPTAEPSPPPQPPRPRTLIEDLLHLRSSE